MSFDKVSDIKPNQVIYIEVDFSEGLETKRRPCVVVFVNDEDIGRFPIYSFKENGYESRPEEVQRVLYEIKDWAQVGLERLSWVDMSEFDVVNSKYLNIEIKGRFTQNDVKGLIKAYTAYLETL